MAMAACLVAKLRRLARSGGVDLTGDAGKFLVPMEPLRYLIGRLFRFQGESGIWPKFFPLFLDPHYGPTYCFSFEMLEAILNEFVLARTDAHEPGLFEDEAVFTGFAKAVSWCENNRLTFRYQAAKETTATEFSGWNSGGQTESLYRGAPECWATAMVHMFLFRLREALSRAVQQRILKKYGCHDLEPLVKQDKWRGYIDSPVELPGELDSTVKKLVEGELLDHAKKIKPGQRGPIQPRCSALLFGPPGTSKTQLVRAVAEKLGWPLVEIIPAHFLSEGMEKIYIRADEIFEDLHDLARAVVFFDELDAFVRSRSGGSTATLDVTSQFLTTSMLPKLAKLHDQAGVLFFMATNYRKGFDEAITRPGRFDLLIHMRPPETKDKLDRISFFLSAEDQKDDKAIAGLLESWLDPACKKLFDRFTFGEVKAFFEFLIRKGKPRLLGALNAMRSDEFRRYLTEWGTSRITLREKPNPVLEDFENDRTESRIQ
jgi:hypothetical protein